MYPTIKIFGIVTLVLLSTAYTSSANTAKASLDKSSAAAPAAGTSSFARGYKVVQTKNQTLYCRSEKQLKAQQEAGRALKDSVTNRPNQPCEQPPCLE